MAVDSYAPCPGGTGKKIKFCCSDLINDLGKIRRMLEGDQRLACLDHVKSLHAKHGDRACLLAVKSMLEEELGSEGAAESTVQAFLSKYPNNPVATAEQAIIKAGAGETRAALEWLSQAIEVSGKEIPARVYEAIGTVALAALNDGEIISARALLMLQAAMAGPDSQEPLSYLMPILGSPEIPLLFKDPLAWPEAPAGVAWENDYHEAMRFAGRGAWRGAADRLQKLRTTAGDHPVLWQALAYLYARLSEKPAAIEALRKFASLDVPLDDAVEAEALAQLLDEDSIGEEIDVLTVTFEIGDISAFDSKMTDKQLSRLHVDLSQMAAENEPPPKAAFWLLDRPMPDSGAGITLDAAPHVLGSIYVFGKQTDREARVELAVKRPLLESAQRELLKIAGGSLKEPTEGPKETTKISATSDALAWNWRLPDDTPRELRQSLMLEQRQQIIFDRWPSTPMRLLDGKTPQQAATEPNYRVKLLAAILLLEQTDSEGYLEDDYNKLRAKLNLPINGPIDPTTVADPSNMPVIRFARVDMSKLSDDAVIKIYRKTQMVRAEMAYRKVVEQLLGRSSLEGKFDPVLVYGSLARLEHDTEKAIGYIDQARKAAESAGKSTAQWDLEELTCHLQLGNGPEVERLLVHISENHMREPGVAQALQELLAQAGLIPPGAQLPLAPAGSAQPSIVVPGAAAEPGKLWTPDSAQPTGKKSAIWTPD